MISKDFVSRDERVDAQSGHEQKLAGALSWMNSHAPSLWCLHPDHSPRRPSFDGRPARPLPSRREIILRGMRERARRAGR